MAEDKKVEGQPMGDPAGMPPLPTNPATGKPYTQDELRAMAEDRNNKIQQGIELLKAAFGPGGFVLITGGGITYAVGDPFRMAGMLERAAKNAREEGDRMFAAAGWNDRSLSVVPPQAGDSPYPPPAGSRPAAARNVGQQRKPNLKAAPPPAKEPPQAAPSGDGAPAQAQDAASPAAPAEPPQAAPGGADDGRKE